MEKLKVLFITLFVSIIFIPLSFYLKKFTTIEAAQKPSVSYDQLICMECEDCPCTFTFNEGQKHTINSTDKNACITAVKHAFRSPETTTDTTTVFMDYFDYRQFKDCIKWYSRHPSSF